MPHFRTLLCLLLLASAIHGVAVLWHIYHDHWPADAYDRPILVKGMIANLPHQKDHAEQFWLKTDHGLIQLNGYYPFPRLKPGEIWQLPVKIKPDAFQNNSGEFDYGAYLRTQGIVASGYVIAKSGVVKLGYHPWQTPLESLRFAVYQRIIAATNGLKMQGILIALILGDKTLLNPRQWQVFSESGTSYFMVISGLHIVLFAAMGGLLARYGWCLIPRAALRIPGQTVGLCFGLIFGLFYSLLAGFPVPTQRALWMLWLMGMARLLLERIHSMTLLFAACLIVLAWDPLSFKSVAFWLSFIAVFFLVYTLASRFGKMNKIEEWLYPQWVMYLTLMPILIYVFHTFSLISVLTNFIAMPFMMLAVIPLALLGGLILFINTAAGHSLFVISNFIMTGLWFILEWATDLPHSLILLPQPSLWTVILSLLGCLILFAPKGLPLRFAGMLLLLPLLIPKPLFKDNTFTTTPLQIEDGEVSIIEMPHFVMVVQTIHYLRQAKSAIHSVIEPYLQTHGESEVNVLIVNGSKNDHALQTLQNSWTSTQIDTIILPHMPKTFDSAISSCETPQKFAVGQFHVMVSLVNQTCQVTLE